MSADIAVLISGRGSNLRAILQSPAGAHVAAVISDNPQAAGIEHAEAHNKEIYIVTPDDFDKHEEWAEKLCELLDAINPRIIALAGFMRILPPPVVRAFAGKMVNIHPSLLPAFPGLNTHARALAAGATTHGCTVHWVTEEVDAGEIIEQSPVPVLPEDDAETLAARVLVKEHELYAKVLLRLLALK